MEAKQEEVFDRVGRPCVEKYATSNVYFEYFIYMYIYIYISLYKDR